MEKKTIGSFISALRKANGMTQKDLAQRLNVSDKTVSRWERDDGTPDLSLIPVLAEIFEVTCDELLRGVRKPPSPTSDSAPNAESTAKGEKQRQRLLTASLSRYRSQTFIAMGISLAGLIAAMVGNFGFLRAYLGFLAGTVFYLVSVICQAVFLNSAFLSVSDDALAGPQLGQFKWSVIRLAELSFGLTVALLGFSLPLVLSSYSTYAGLNADFWLLSGVLTGGTLLLIFSVLLFFLNPQLLKKGGCTMDSPQALEVYTRNHRLKGTYAIVLTAIVLVTCVVHAAMTNIWGPWTIMEGTSFDNYQSFVAFMEQDTAPIGTAPDNAIEQGTYYDEAGNPISEEEALTQTLEDKNGTVVCQYLHRNHAVVSIQYTPKDGSVLPVTVYTDADFKKAQDKAAIRHVIFGGIYCVELACAALIYFKKRTRWSS